MPAIKLGIQATQKVPSFSGWIPSSCRASVPTLGLSVLRCQDLLTSFPKKDFAVSSMYIAGLKRTGVSFFEFRINSFERPVAGP